MRCAPWYAVDGLPGRGRRGCRWARRSRRRSRSGRAELDLEGEPLGEVAVVGEREDAAGRVGGEPTDEEQCVARSHSEQLGVLVAGQAGGDDLPDRGDAVPVAGQGLPDTGAGRRVPATRPARSAGTHSRTTSRPSPSTVRSDRAESTSVPSSTPSEPGEGEGSGPVPELHDMTVDGLAGLGHRGRRVPERADGQPLVERRPGHEPAGPVAGLDQPLVPQHLEGAPNGRARHRIPGTELRLGVERADVPELPEGDALPEVVGDGGEPRTCH